MGIEQFSISDLEVSEIDPSAVNFLRGADWEQVFQKMENLNLIRSEIDSATKGAYYVLHPLAHEWLRYRLDHDPNERGRLVAMATLILQQAKGGELLDLITEENVEVADPLKQYPLIAIFAEKVVDVSAEVLVFYISTITKAYVFGETEWLDLRDVRELIDVENSLLEGTYSKAQPMTTALFLMARFFHNAFQLKL